MVRAPKDFLDTVLWPEFSDLDQALWTYLIEATLRVVREEIYSDATDAREVSEAPPSKYTHCAIRRRPAISWLRAQPSTPKEATRAAG
jgi:hypothetical protein